MKNLMLLVLCFVAFRAFSQTNELVIQEKSSDWIKVLSMPTATKSNTTKPKTTTTVKRKTRARKPSVPKQDAQEEFEKTNSKVNRFKKVKKG